MNSMGNSTRHHAARLAVRTVVPGVLAAAGLVLAAVSASAVAPATYCHVQSCSHALNPQPLPPRGDD